MAALGPVAITGIGLMAPGLVGWTASKAVLRGTSKHRYLPLPELRPALLASGDRRRTTPLVRLALAAAEDALCGRRGEARAMASVFASSGGDLGIVDRICQALLMDDRPVSPTHFHNSVHNAAAGYWAIAAGCRRPSVSLSAFEDTFAAGLAESVSMVEAEAAQVLLVAYDQPGPLPFQGHRPVTEPFAVALVLAPESSEPRLAKLALGRAGSAEPPPPLADPGLEELRCANPAARSLPLLLAVAGANNDVVRLSEEMGLLVEAGALEEEMF